MSPTSTTQQPVTSRGYEIGTRGSHNIARGGKHPYQLPKFTDKKKSVNGCFNIWQLHLGFSRKGYTEGTAGHISIRDPVDPNTFWINPLGKHFGLLKASDMVHVDHEGNILPDGAQVAINAAGFSIHSALHHSRPDVHAACHTHSVYGKAWSAMGKPLAMINQDVCTFYKSHAVYEDFGGVALEAEEGIHISKSFG